MRRFVAVDVETGGLDPRKHPLIEVGLIVETYAGEAMPLAFSLPFDVEECEPRALEVNGWGKREFAPQIPEEEAALLLQDHLHDVHLVGKNPQFDAAFLEQFLGKTPWHHRMIDVGTLTWGWHNRECHAYEEPHLDQPPNVEKTEALMQVYVPEDQRHTALGDARWAYEVFRKVVPR